MRFIQTYYNTHILPFFLNRAMKRGGFTVHRHEVTRDAFGIVLEIGFGSGLNLPYYNQEHVEKLYALEPSQELFSLAEKNMIGDVKYQDLIDTKPSKLPFHIEHIRSSAENIPLDTDSIDTVVSTWTLCSIPHPEEALREIFRVLKPGGKFFFIEHGLSPRKTISRIQHICTPFSKCLAGGCHLNRDIEHLLSGAGFTIERMEKFDQKNKPLAYMYKGVVIAEKGISISKT